MIKRSDGTTDFDPIECLETAIRKLNIEVIPNMDAALASLKYDRANKEATPSGYVIRYPNHPNFKGMDTWFGYMWVGVDRVPRTDRVSKFAYVFKYRESAEAAKNAIPPGLGQLDPVVEPVYNA